MAEINEPPKIPDPSTLDRNGGYRHGKTVQQGPWRSGEDVMKDWEKTHGNIEESALERKKRRRETGEI